MATIIEYATLSNLVYEPSGGNPGADWERYLPSDEAGVGVSSGYYGVAYLNRKTNEIVIAHRGTELLKLDTGDLKADWQTLTGQAPDQFPDAELFYMAVRQKVTSDPGLTNVSYSHTGHSLGGAIARYLAAEWSQVGVLFNAPGVAYDAGTTNQLPPNADLSKITAVNAQYDKVSKFGTHSYKVIEKFVSYLGPVPDAWEPLLLLLTFKIPLLGLLTNAHYYYTQHDMDELLAVIQADPNLSRFDPAVGPLDVTAGDQIVGAGLNEWADLEQALQTDPTLWTGSLLPEDELTAAQIRAEQNIDPDSPVVYDHNGPATWVVGENGDDMLAGGDGNDLLFGDDGDDTLNGENGNDILIGGVGFDTYLVGQGSDTIIDTDGQGQLRYLNGDQIQSLILGIRESTDPQGQYKSPDGQSTFTWSGTPGADLTIQTAGGSITIKDFTEGNLGVRFVEEPSLIPQTVFTASDNDDVDLLDFGLSPTMAGGQVLGYASNPFIDNELGRYVDNWDYAEVGEVFNTRDTSYDIGNVYFHREEFIPGTGLLVTDRALYGLGGNDYLVGFPGARETLLDGGSGNDWIIADYGDIYNLNHQILTPTGYSSFFRYADYSTGFGATLYGGDGHDAIQGSYRDDWIEAGTGHDQVQGGEEDDYIDGGTGNDWIDGSKLDGSADDDILIGGPDSLTEGESDNDVLMGGAGKDILIGGAGDDLMYGDADGYFMHRLIKVSNYSTTYPLGYPVPTYGRPSYGMVGWDGATGSYVIPNFDDSERTVALYKDAQGAGDDYLDGGAGQDQLFGGEGADILDGGSENDKLYGEGGDDELHGGAGDDELWGDINPTVYEQDQQITETHGTLSVFTRQYVGGPDVSGDDLLEGGTGDDHLHGGAGDDTYFFGLGDGHDTIEDIVSSNESNLIRFGGGIRYEDVVGSLNGNGLLLQVGAGGDSIQLKNFDLSGNHVVEYLEFFDRGLVPILDFVPHPTEGDDTDNILYGTSQDDVLVGYGGDDRIVSSVGDDTLAGGAGSDVLEGGFGDDTYLFNLGDGIDTIVDQALPGKGNRIVFGEGITPVSLSLGIGSLLVRVGNSGDAIHVVGFDLNDAYGPHSIETFVFADGVILTYSELISRGFELAGSDADDTITGTNVVDRITGGPGNDLLQGGEGDDTYIYNFGEGIDTIVDSDGLGRIVYRDAGGMEYLLEGGARILPDDNTYSAQDGRFTYHLDETTHSLTVVLDGQTALRIENYDPDARTVGVAIRTYQAPQIRTPGAASGGLRLVSTAADGTQTYPYTYSYSPSLSADGRYAVFVSDAYNLVPGSGYEYDIFVKDLQTGEIARASSAADGTAADGYNISPAISADGRYVAFTSHASNFITPDLSGIPLDILDLVDRYLDDVSDPETEIPDISLLAEKVHAALVRAGAGDIPDIASLAEMFSVLLDGDTNQALDIFVKDMITGEIIRVNTDVDGNQAQDYSYTNNSSISADGRFVVFQSSARNLVVDDTNWAYDVFVKDVLTGAIVRVSTAADGVEANDYSFADAQALSADGRYVVFRSYASNLVPGDTNRVQDIFVKDLQTGIVTRANTAAGGSQANADSELSAISADGRYVVIQSVASNLVDGDTNGFSDIFVKDLWTGAMARVSTAQDGTQADSGSDFCALSGDGRYVVFRSGATNLVPGGTDGGSHIFVKDLQAGAVARVSVTADGSEPNGGSDDASISADGQYLIFRSDASNLIIGDTNNASDIFVVPNLFLSALSAPSTTANTPLVIQGISITDADAGISPLILSLTVDHGSLDLEDSTSVAFLDPDGSDGNLVFTGTLADLNAALRAGIRYLPGRYYAGDDMLSLVVNDQSLGDGITDNANLALTIISTNHDPVLTSPIADQATEEDAPFAIVAASFFADADLANGDVLTYGATLADASPLPAWLNFDTVTGTFYGTPLQADVGSLDIVVSVTDSMGRFVTDAFTVLVNNVNDAPIVAIPMANQTADEDAVFGFTLPADSFTDEDNVLGDTLLLAATLADGSTSPDWLIFDAVTATFSGTPTNADVRSYDIRVTATDTAGASAPDVFTLTVNNVNDAPVLANALTDQGATEGVSFGFAAPADTFHDDDAIHGDVLSYTASLADGAALPSWLSFDAATRAFAGTAPKDSMLAGTEGNDVLVDADAGIAAAYDIRVTATDAEGASAVDDFLLTLQGIPGDDTLEGKGGNDVLNGGAGNDSYLYNLGDGLDTLTDASGTDTIVLGTGYNFDNTVIRTDGNIARLRFLDADGCEGTDGMDIALDGDGSFPIEAFAFADGSRYTLNDLLITSQIWYGTKKADTLITGRNDDTVYADKGDDTAYGGSGHDTLYGDKGRDRLYGEGGNDALYGDKGDDILDGGAGDDVLDGGEGHNTLIGGQGDDILFLGGGGENRLFIYARDGWDTLKTTDKDPEDNDLVFGPGITKDSLWFSRAGNDLVINLLGTNDGLTVEGWYNSKHKPLEEIQTSDGAELEAKQVELLVQAMAAFGPVPGSGDALPTAMPDALQATLAAAWETEH